MSCLKFEFEGDLTKAGLIGLNRMDRRRRIIYESDEDENEEKIRSNLVSNQQNKGIDSHQNDNPESEGVKSEEEWDSNEYFEFMHGQCDDEVGAIPLKIINEQLGDDGGVEYEIIFQEVKGNGKTSTYNDWVREVDLTKRMRKLKQEYEDQEGFISDDEKSTNEGINHENNYSNDENEQQEITLGSHGKIPAAPRRSSRGSSSGTRKAVTRQKLNDLMELRNRTKSGLGILQYSSEESEIDRSEGNHSNGNVEGSSDDEIIIRGRKKFQQPVTPVKTKPVETPKMFKKRSIELDRDDEEIDQDDDIENFIVNDDEDEDQLYEADVLEERY